MAKAKIHDVADEATDDVPGPAPAKVGDTVICTGPDLAFGEAPGIVTAILENSVLLVTIFDSEGTYRSAREYYDPNRAAGTWHWPED